jgi:predicted  nucleic acid-binding Zn-ribbon protein
MVTLEGELLVPGGAISGGAFKNNSNLLGRRREMDELEKKVKKLSEDITTYNQKIEDTKSKRNKLRMDLEALKTEMQRKSIEQNTARLNISQARERMEEEAESAQSLKLEEQEIETKIFEIRSGKESITQELAASEELEKTTQEQILGFQKELESCRLEESEASAHAGEWEVKVEKMRQALDYKQANVDRIGGELERAQAELKEILEALTENAQEVERKKNNILEIEKTIAASHENQDASRKKLDEDLAKKEELSAKQKDFFRSREEMSERMNALDKEVYRLGEQKKKLEDGIEGQINYMWDEYEITLSDAAGLRNEEMNDLPAMKREISGLKDEIRKLGNVNVNAIEDYKNLMERYTFMKTQHDDLVEAYPGDMINAALAVDAGFLSPFDVTHAAVNEVQGREGLGYIQTRWEEDTLNNRGIYKDSKWPGLYDRLETWADGNGYLKLPVLKYLFVPGSYLWLYLALAAILVIVDRKRYCLPLAVIAGYYGTMLLGPTVQMRYVYPVMLALPYLVALMCGTGRKTENEKTETETKQRQR